MAINRCSCFAFAVLLIAPGAVLAATTTPMAAPAVKLTLVAKGAGQPVTLQEPPDGSGRLFVVDRQGAVRIIAGGKLLAAPYLKVAVATDSEQGLLGLAFDPDFKRNGVFYLSRTATPDAPRLGTLPDQVLTRYTAADPAADAFKGSQEDVLHIPDLYGNHNGGDIHFGPDGYLYWSMGDGGKGGDPHDFAQNLWRQTVAGKTYYLLGKLLRLDVRHGGSIATAETCGGKAGTPLAYRIPRDNPFVASRQTCDEIDHYGLRNPWRFTFDRPAGTLIIGDVGQDQWEEIDRVKATARGLDFGWNCREGHAEYQPANCAHAAKLVAPVFDYSHGDGCSITGGVVYRGPAKALQGAYFYGDFCRRELRYGWPERAAWHIGTGSAGTPLAAGVKLDGGPIGFGTDQAGNVYALTMTGRVWRIDQAPTAVPSTR